MGAEPVEIWKLDFETFFSDDYTLKKSTTESYIRDPRFESLLLGVKDPSGQRYWVPQPEIPAFLASVDWSKAAIMAHHAQFDGLILAHHYGVKPALHLCTLSMGRLTLGNHLSVGLDALAMHYGLQGKTVPYQAFKGKHWSEIAGTPLEQELGHGCLHDIDLMDGIFGELSKDFPAEEYHVIDLTIRMFTEPTLRGDMDLLGKVWISEEKRKATMLQDIGVSADQLQSAEQFADLLRAEGVEPATKDGKHGPIYAFAKTDDFMRDLLESDDQRLSDLATARLGVKSTIDQTRAEALGNAASRGALPVYLRYAGAHTTRWAGGDNSNFQNFRRGGDLRKSIMAPPGCKLVVLDLSQIEARILAVVAGQWDLVEKFRNGEDPYVGIASEFYGKEVTKAMPLERGTGKQLVLSCGYGSGAATIKQTAKKGQYGPPVILTDERAEEAKELYRTRNPAIVRYWRDAGNMLNVLSARFDRGWGCMEIRNKRIILPNGAPIIYDTLEWDPELTNWKYRTRRGWTKIWGSKLVAETTQALARVVASQAMLRIKAAGIWLAWCTHDDIVAVVPDAHAQAAYDYMLQEMKRPPAWLPELPLDAEGFIGDRYAK